MAFRTNKDRRILQNQGFCSQAKKKKKILKKSLYAKTKIKQEFVMCFLIAVKCSHFNNVCFFNLFIQVDLMVLHQDSQVFPYIYLTQQVHLTERCVSRTPSSPQKPFQLYSTQRVLYKANTSSTTTRDSQELRIPKDTLNMHLMSFVKWKFMVRRIFY